jgi:ATP/maltotriose-dependent transcriptional regulator MalT
LAQGTNEEVVAGHVNLSFILFSDGRLEQAANVALSGLDEAVRRGAAAADGALLAANAASPLTRLGRLHDAETVVREALERKPPPGLESILLLALAEIDVLQGRPDEALAAMRAIASHGIPGDYQFQGQMRAAEAELQLWNPSFGATFLLGDLASVLGSEVAALDGEDDVLLAARLCWLGVRADADAAAFAEINDDKDRLRRISDDSGSLVRRIRELSTRQVASGTRRQLDALLLLATAEESRLHEVPQPVLWEEAAQTAEGDPYLQGYALWRLGAARRDARQRREARDAFRAAYSLASAYGLEVLAQAVRSAGLSLGQRLTDADVPAQATRQTRRFGLTPREEEVLGLLVEGYTNRRIASALAMSEKTASVHVSRILSKLSVGSRGEAVARAYEIGLARPRGVQQG